MTPATRLARRVLLNLQASARMTGYGDPSSDAAAERYRTAYRVTAGNTVRQMLAEGLDTSELEAELNTLTDDDARYVRRLLDAD